MRDMSVLAVNARIAAASLSIGMLDFTVFTSEIARLACHATAAVQQIAGAHRQFATLLGTARQQHAAFERTHAVRLEEAAEGLSATLDAIEGRRARAADTALEIGTRSKAIGERINLAVASLQIGDITRQRVEHIDDALGLLLGGVAPADGAAPAAWRDGLDARHCDAVVAEVSRLLCAQLAEMLAAFERESGQVASALASVAAANRAMQELDARTYGGAGTHGSFLGDLAGEMRKVSALLQQCDVGRAAIDQASGAMAEHLDALGTHIGGVSEIEADMRLLGLNTALRCGRLGSEGRVLNVIAQQLRVYGGSVIADAQAVTGSLRELTETSAALAAVVASRNAVGLDALERQMSRSVERLAAVGASLARSLELVESEGGDVARLLAAAGEAIGRETAIATALRRMLGEFDRVAAAARHAAAQACGPGGVPAVPRTLLMSLIQDRYTMSAERQVHGAVVADAHGTARPTEAATEAAMLDDVLF
jgi:hypothetical protein